MPVLAGTLRGRSTAADPGWPGNDRHLNRVVVPVVAALDLDDEVAAGDGAHQMDGFHRRLGPRVAEPPERQAEALAEALGDNDGVFCRLGEVRAPADLVTHRLDDRRMSVTSEAGSVATVQVDVFGPVDVVDLRADAVADPDGLGPGDLPAGRDPAGERAGGPLAHRPGVGLASEEHLLLFSDEGVEVLLDCGRCGLGLGCHG